jgi:hypothetical protein
MVRASFRKKALARGLPVPPRSNATTRKSVWLYFPLLVEQKQARPGWLGSWLDRILLEAFRSQKAGLWGWEKAAAQVVHRNRLGELDKSLVAAPGWVGPGGSLARCPGRAANQRFQPAIVVEMRADWAAVPVGAGSLAVVAEAIDSLVGEPPAEVDTSVAAVEVDTSVEAAEPGKRVAMVDGALRADWELVGEVDSWALEQMPVVAPDS